MKLLPFLFAALIAGGLVFALYTGMAGDARSARSPAPALPSSDAGQSERVARLEDLVLELTRQIDRLTQDVTALQGRERVPLVTGPAGLEPRAERTADARDPRWYLDQYVDSFRRGGEGSEYFRLAVDAFLPSLLEPVLTLAATRGANATLRLRLVEMIGDERFRLEPRVVKSLVERVGEARDDALVLAALEGLPVVADARTAPALERVVWRLTTERVLGACIRCILQLAAADANRAIASLMKSAPDERSRVLLISLIEHSDLAAALDVFRFASYDEKAVRLAAANRMREFPGEPFVPFTEEWIGREPDAEVRAALGQTLEHQKQIPPHHPMRMTGAPDVPNPSSDDHHAWASQTPDGGDEWVELTYEVPMKAHAIRIHETCTAGAVTSVHALDSTGARHRVWAGDDPTGTAGVFEVTFETTSFPVAGVRIELDTKRTTGWNEIDAVELIGRGGRAWAKSARASSYYGAGRSSRQIGSMRFFER